MTTTTADPFALPEDLAQLEPATPQSEDEPPKDTKPKRPTTREGRRIAAAQAKAKAAAAGKDTKPKSAKPTPRRAPLEARLAASIASIGTMVMVSGALVSPAISADGLVIAQHSGSVAAALDKVAKDDPRVAAALERMLTAGVWSGLLGALVPVALGIAANHGAIPANIAAMLGTEGDGPTEGNGIV